MTEKKRRAVFLDRDGVLIEDVNYLTCRERVRVLPGVPGALQRLRNAGYLLLVVTNQSAVARGWLTEQELADIHAELQSRLAERGAQVDAIYYCPHLPEGKVQQYTRNCQCRKPAPGLINRGAREWNVETAQSYMVGDSARDIAAGRAAGCQTIAVGRARGSGADADVPNLPAAADFILSAQ